MSCAFPKNFSLAEMIHSDTAVRRNIDNEPTKEERNNLILTANHLQKLRDDLACPIRVNSGFRSLLLNTLLGGDSSSYHMDGLAADIVISSIPPRELCNFIAAMDYGFDTVIVEFDRWVHVNLARDGVKPRGRVLEAYKDGGITLYRKFVL